MNNQPVHYSRSSFLRSGEPPIAVVRSPLQAPHIQHTHDFDELVIVTEGKGEHITPALSYPISRGDVFIVRESGSHGYESTEDLVVINIIFDSDQMGAPLRELAELPGYHALFVCEPAQREQQSFGGRLHLTASELQRTLNSISRIESELESKEPGYGMLVTAMFVRMVAFLAQAYSTKESPCAQELIRLGSALSHIETNVDGDILVEELARMSHLSPRQFHRVFRNVTGVSPLQYQLNLRVEKAKYSLAQSDESLTEIAFQTGFTDSNYFCRLFRQKTGMSPGAYRKQHRLQ
ncbi:MAG: helix-turn-helix domain-containing protein [Planctomycetes bacterium]|nr:helix-turn-helix domain-containing protein [Planctomycetota bacterium]